MITIRLDTSQEEELTAPNLQIEASHFCDFIIGFFCNFIFFFIFLYGVIDDIYIYILSSLVYPQIYLI